MLCYVMLSIFICHEEFIIYYTVEHTRTHTGVIALTGPL